MFIKKLDQNTLISFLPYHILSHLSPSSLHHRRYVCRPCSSLVPRAPRSGLAPRPPPVRPRGRRFGPDPRVRGPARLPRRLHVRRLPPLGLPCSHGAPPRPRAPLQSGSAARPRSRSIRRASAAARWPPTAPRCFVWEVVSLSASPSSVVARRPSVPLSLGPLTQSPPHQAADGRRHRRAPRQLGVEAEE